jgi:hypothetical protein
MYTGDQLAPLLSYFLGRAYRGESSLGLGLGLGLATDLWVLGPVGLRYEHTVQESLRNWLASP